MERLRSLNKGKDRSATHEPKKTPKNIYDLEDPWNLEDKPTSIDKTPPKTPSSKKNKVDIGRQNTGLPAQKNALRKSWLQEKWVENTHEKDSIVDYSISKPQGEDDCLNLNEVEEFVTKK